MKRFVAIRAGFTETLRWGAASMHPSERIYKTFCMSQFPGKTAPERNGGGQGSRVDLRRTEPGLHLSHLVFVVPHPSESTCVKSGLSSLTTPWGRSLDYG